MNEKIAVIGAGNMGGAILSGLVSRKAFALENIMACDVSEEALGAASELGIKTTSDLINAAGFGDIILLAVKPGMLGDVLQKVQSQLTKEKLVISIAAGVMTGTIRSCIPHASCRILRVMPNLPVVAGEGMSVICPNDLSVQEDIALAERIFSSFGVARVLPEDKIDSFVAIASSSPAMLFLILEAMADGGVMLGLSRAQSYEMAAQAMIGSGRMILDGNLPAAMKDAVCSPGGASIEMIAVLEDDGVRGSIIRAMEACWEKCRKL